MVHAFIYIKLNTKIYSKKFENLTSKYIKNIKLLCVSIYDCTIFLLWLIENYCYKIKIIPIYKLRILSINILMYQFKCLKISI